MYEKLRSPIRIGKLVVQNRTVMPAMGVNLAAPDGGVTDDITAFYEARAKGGVGLIITEVTRISDGAGISDPCQLAAWRFSDVAGLQRLVDVIHRYGTSIFIQLQHPGREASPYICGEQPVAPSPVPNPNGGTVPRELTTEECAEFAQKFTRAALIAKIAGADGIELHGAHGYLINEFLSPAMNFRKDVYGGSFENRMRFVTEILEGIRRECGRDFPVSVRINAEEALPGGIDLQEAVRIAAALEKAGADAINVSCYSEGCIEPGTYEQGWKKYMAEAIKKAVSIPVIAVCNIKEPSVAESLLQEGVCDLAGIGRALLADPDWCKKAFTGRENEIRKCIGCLACFGEIVKLKQVRCSVNPLTGREREYSSPVRNGAGRTVAVIGCGPAGMEAALTLKERGFNPVVFDETSQPGGTLNVADKGYAKKKITAYTESMKCQLESAGVELRLNVKATPETISALKPYGVFLACGAEPLIPAVDGVDSPNVCTAEDVLLGRVKPSGDVAVIGLGMTGLETAEVLAMEGCKLTLVEMLSAPGVGMYPSIVSDVMSRITPHNPVILTGHRLEKITPSGIELTRLSDGKRVSVQVGHVVLSLGVRSRKELLNSFMDVFPDLRIIGDACKGGRILEATQDARGKAFVFE